MNNKTKEALKRVRAQECFGRYESKEVGLYQTEDVGALLDAYDDLVLKMELQINFVELFLESEPEGSTTRTALQHVLDYLNVGINDVLTS